jgi:hypothetical protein
MTKYLWFSMVGLVVLAAVTVYHFSSATSEKVVDTPSSLPFDGALVVLPFRMDVRGFTILETSPSGFPKLVIRQGETGILNILFTRQYTDGNVPLKLWFYGIAPNFDIWQNTWDVQNMNLPDGITCSISPSTLELSTDNTYSADLTIVASPNARVGNFKVMVNVWFPSSHTENRTAGTGKSFTLEIVPMS